MEEIQQEKEFIVYKAARTYKDNRGTKFSSYLGSYVRWYCLNKINKSKDWKHFSDEPLETIPDEEKDETIQEYINYLINSIDDKRTKRVLELRYFSGSKLLSWNKIGEMIGGVSGQTCNNLHSKALRLLGARISGGRA